MTKRSRGRLVAVFCTCLAAAGMASAEEEAKQEAAKEGETKPERALGIGFDDSNLTWGGCPPIFPQDESCQVTVLHGNPAEKQADVFLKVAPNTLLVHHKHTSSERMILVAGQLRVEYDGQNPWVLTAGSYAYGPPELPHTAECIGATPCVLFIGFEEPVDAIAIGGDEKSEEKKDEKK